MRKTKDDIDAFINETAEKMVRYMSSDMDVHGAFDTVVGAMEGSDDRVIARAYQAAIYDAAVSRSIH